MKAWAKGELEKCNLFPLGLWPKDSALMHTDSWKFSFCPKTRPGHWTLAARQKGLPETGIPGPVMGSYMSPTGRKQKGIYIKYWQLGSVAPGLQTPCWFSLYPPLPEVSHYWSQMARRERSKLKEEVNLSTSSLVSGSAEEPKSRGRLKQHIRTGITIQQLS